MKARNWIRAGAGVAALSVVGIWTYAQVASSPRPVAELMPPGALVYLESKDFKRLLADWNGSPEKAAWLNSDNYRAMLRTKLGLRLSEVRSSYTLPSKMLVKTVDAPAPAAPAPARPGSSRLAQAVMPEMSMVESAAGNETAIAVYDIGKLEFLYVTRMSSAALAASVLWQSRDQFQSRTSNGQSYFSKSFDQGVTLSFGTSGDYLFVATREDLVPSALMLISGKSANSIAREDWFRSTVAKAPERAAPDLRLVVNLERVNRAPHYQSYWVQDVELSKEFSALVSDLTFAAGQWREQRVLVRAAARPDRRPEEGAIAELAKRVPASAGYFDLTGNPDPSVVATAVREKILGLDGWSRPGGGMMRAAPPEGGLAEPGAESDLETRIDQAAEQRTSEDLSVYLRPVTGGVEAILRVDRARRLPDGALHGIDSAIALRRKDAWNAEEARKAVEVVLSKAVAAGGGLQWTPRGAGHVLSGLKPVFVAASGNVLVISQSAALGEELVATNAGATNVAGHYAAGYRHGAEFANYQRMMQVMDYPVMPKGVRPQDREPLFFSENIASLGTVLKRLDFATIEVQDNGQQVSQTVTYRLRN